MRWISDEKVWTFVEPRPRYTLVTTGETGNYLHNFLNDDDTTINHEP